MISCHRLFYLLIWRNIFQGHMTEHVRTVHEGKKRIYKEVNCQVTMTNIFRNNAKDFCSTAEKLSAGSGVSISTYHPLMQMSYPLLSSNKRLELWRKDEGSWPRSSWRPGSLCRNCLGNNGKTGSQKYFNRKRYKRYFLETLFKFCFLNTSKLLLLIITKYFYATFFCNTKREGKYPLLLEFSRQPYSFQLACNEFNKIYRAYSYNLCFN